MTQPNWIVISLIGALAGYLLPYLVKAVLYAVRRFRRARIEGKWYVYHITKDTNGKFKVEPDVFKIRKGFLSEFVVNSYKDETRRSNGRLSFERNYWLIALKNIEHKEQVSIRLLNPIPTKDDDPTWGLWLGIDFQGNMIAGPVAISRKELSEDEALRFLLDNTKISSKMKTISVW